MRDLVTYQIIRDRRSIRECRLQLLFQLADNVWVAETAPKDIDEGVGSGPTASKPVHSFVSSVRIKLVLCLELVGPSYMPPIHSSASSESFRGRPK